MGAESDATRCAAWLCHISADVRSAGDVPLVRLDEDGVTQEPIALSDELWLVASTLDFDTAMTTAAKIRERNGE